MKTLLSIAVLSFRLIYSQFPTSGFGQTLCDHPETRTWIRIEDANSNVDTLWFGYSTGGSCGFDPAACEDGAVEPCGAPADIFCTWWDVCEDTYVIKTYNYHAASSAGQPDTFRLAFWPGPPDPRYPVRLSWSKAGIAALYDSAVIKDLFGGLFYNVQMDLDSTVLLDSTWIKEINIHTYGITTSILSEENYFLPKKSRLRQNYPNPFNPTTTISFELEKTERVLIYITDIVGQVVATLVNGQRIAGPHAVVWDAEDVPSGVYFCRLIIPGDTQISKLILIR